MNYQLGKELKRIRQLKALSLRDVERETGISNAYLSQLERGDAKNPSPQKLATLASFYKVPYDTLMNLAGYLEASSFFAPTDNNDLSVNATSGSDKTKLSTLELVLMNADLSEEEEELVSEYITFLSSRKREKIS